MNSIKFLIRFILFAILIHPTLSFSQNLEKAPSLSRLIERALEKDYDIANQNLSITIDKENQKSLNEVYVPRIEANGKYAYMNGDLTVDLPATTIPVLNIPIFEDHSKFNTSGNLLTADLTASMLIFSGTKIPKLKDAMAEKIKGQVHLVEKSKQELIAKVIESYDQIALLKQAHKVLVESENRLEIEKKTANKAFEYGIITSYEKSKIDLAQASLEAKQQEYLGKRSLLINSLSQMTDFTKEVLSQIDYELEPYLLSELTSDIQNRPEIAALEAAIRANEFKIAAEKTHWLPKIQALASAQYLGIHGSKFKTPYSTAINQSPIHLKANKIESFPTYFVGVGFQWDIFNGFKGKREVNKARIDLQKARNNQDKVNELLNLNLEKAKIEYNLSISQLKTELKRKELAEKAVTIASKEYNVGLIKPSDRIVAENDFQAASMAYIQSIFNQRRAAFNFLQATGNLTIEKL